MAAPVFSTEASKAGNYPAQRFNQRERKLLQSVSEHLAGAFSHKIFAAGNFTTAGGDASETITVSGALSSDIVMVTVKTAGATPRSIVAAAAGAGSVAVTLSGDPSTDHVLSYVVLRANS